MSHSVQKGCFSCQLLAQVDFRYCSPCLLIVDVENTGFRHTAVFYGSSTKTLQVAYVPAREGQIVAFYLELVRYKVLSWGLQPFLNWGTSTAWTTGAQPCVWSHLPKVNLVVFCCPWFTAWHQWVYRKLRFCNSNYVWSGWCKRKRAGSHRDVLKNCCLLWSLLKCSGALNKHLVRTTTLQKLINHRRFSYRRNRAILFEWIKMCSLCLKPGSNLMQIFTEEEKHLLKKISVLEWDRFPPVLVFMSCNFNTVENKAVTALFADLLIDLIRLIMQHLTRGP